MAKQIRCSPVRTMLAHWQKMISGKSPIDMTSLGTRIARYIGVMENAEVTFLPETEAFRYEVGLEHFVQGHIAKGPETLSLCVTPGTIGRSSFHARDSLSLYSVKSLTL